MYIQTQEKSKNQEQSEVLAIKFYWRLKNIKLRKCRKQN